MIDIPMYSRWVLLIDLLVIPFVFGTFLLFFHQGYVLEQLFSYNLAMLLVIHVGINWMTGRYSVKHDIASVGYFAEYMIIGLIALFAILLYSLGLQHFIRPGMTPMSGLFASSLGISFISLYLRRELYQITRIEENMKELIVVGTGEKARRFYQTLQEKRPYKHYSFFALDDNQLDAHQHLLEDDLSSPVIKTGLSSYLKKSRRPIGSIVLAEESNVVSPGIIKQLVSAKFSHIEVKTLAQYHADKWQCYPVYDLSPFWNLEDSIYQQESIFSYLTTKRIMDVFLAGSVLLLLSPLALLLAVAIRLESKGHPIFKQSRVGYKGQIFTIYKFRSMTIGSEKGDVYTRKGDKRVTRLGGFMRKTRLDEIPQLWNILKGDMSLIGPRPEWNVLVERYEREIEFYHFRHLVKPGLTGWAQVNYSYGANLHDTIEKLKYDLFYVQKSSPKLDLMVVLKTIYTILGLKGL